jgi:dephospho-CoA kinase
LLKVGLTGAIGTGKSAVGRMLAALGARVIEADSIARKLMRPEQKVYDEVVRSFGREILSADGTIDRRKLADAAFGTPENPIGRAQELNHLVHPAVGRAQEEWMAAMGRSDREAIVVVEAALIFEAGLQGQFDRIVVVTCPFQTRVRRWMSRTGVDEATARRELERRMAAQWPEEKKIAIADYLVGNSGSEPETETKVRELYTRLKPEAVRAR